MAVVVGVAATFAGPGVVPAGALPLGGLRPAAVDVAALHAEALQVVTRDYQAAVDQASAALTSADGQQQSASATLTRDQGTQTDDATRAATAAQTLTTTTAAHQTAVAAHSAAVQTLTTDQDSLAQVGIALYMGPPPAVPAVATDLQGADTSADGSLYLRTGDRELTTAIHTDRQQATSTAATEKRLAQQVGADQLAVTAADTAQQQAAATVATDQATLAATKQAAALAQADLTGKQQAMTAAVTGFGNPAPDGSPTILGPSALVPAQLAGWFASSSYNDQTTATPAQLAAWYVSEGTAEGVRGDVAFAQAIIETGGFSSPDAITLSNFAGIGHCDACAAGLAFPSPQGGVRGQVQLLRIFASPPGTPLLQPAIVPQVAPGGQFRGGCCPSWQSLTGTWASNPQYGQVVLTLYQKMLDYALSKPPIIPGSPAAGDQPAAPGPGAPASPSTTRPGG